MLQNSTDRPASGAPTQSRKSRTIAQIFPERCTGCEACIAVAPWVDCIGKVDQDPNKPFGMVVCEIQTDKCTGCTLCMKICPWDAISMVPRPGSEAPAPKPAG